MKRQGVLGDRDHAVDGRARPNAAHGYTPRIERSMIARLDKRKDTREVEVVATEPGGERNLADRDTQRVEGSARLGAAHRRSCEPTDTVRDVSEASARPQGSAETGGAPAISTGKGRGYAYTSARGPPCRTDIAHSRGDFQSKPSSWLRC